MEVFLESVRIKRELSDYEMERGKPTPSKNHGLLQSNICTEINIRYRKTYTLLSEIDLQMPEKPNCVPDIAIYPKLKIDFQEDEISMKQIPLTTIEILSPTQSENELVDKAKRYFAAGVKSCWIVLPIFKAVVLYSSPTNRQIFTEDLTLVDAATGIELPLAEIFE